MRRPRLHVRLGFTCSTYLLGLAAFTPTEVACTPSLLAFWSCWSRLVACAPAAAAFAISLPAFSSAYVCNSPLAADVRDTSPEEPPFSVVSPKGFVLGKQVVVTNRPAVCDERWFASRRQARWFYSAHFVLFCPRFQMHSNRIRVLMCVLFLNVFSEPSCFCGH